MARHTDDAVFHLHGGTGDVSCDLSSPDTNDARTRRGSHMLRTAIVGITAVVVVALAASTSLAASPTKAGVYEGTLYASGTAALTKVVRLKVAATGKSARVTWSCGTGRAPSTLQFAIKADGTFRGVQQHRHADGVVVRRQIRLPEASPRSASPEHDLRRQGRHAQPRTQGITDELRLPRRPH